jgi:hypothetical protein
MQASRFLCQLLPTVACTSVCSKRTEPDKHTGTARLSYISGRQRSTRCNRSSQVQFHKWPTAPSGTGAHRAMHIGHAYISGLTASGPNRPACLQLASTGKMSITHFIILGCTPSTLQSQSLLEVQSPCQLAASSLLEPRVHCSPPQFLQHPKQQQCAPQSQPSCSWPCSPFRPFHTLHHLAGGSQSGGMSTSAMSGRAIEAPICAVICPACKGLLGGQARSQHREPEMVGAHLRTNSTFPLPVPPAGSHHLLHHQGQWVASNMFDEVRQLMRRGPAFATTCQLLSPATAAHLCNMSPGS